MKNWRGAGFMEQVLVTFEKVQRVGIEALKVRTQDFKEHESLNRI